MEPETAPEDGSLQRTSFQVPCLQVPRHFGSAKRPCAGYLFRADLPRASKASKSSYVSWALQEHLSTLPAVRFPLDYSKIRSTRGEPWGVVKRRGVLGGPMHVELEAL